MNISYVEDGNPDHQDVLLLHGIHAAGSSKEFDQIFDLLAAEYHVIAPDLPGFGRSDRPAVTYSADLYEEFIRDFTQDRADDAVCIASSLTGSYAAIVQRDYALFSQLVLICPTDEAWTEWGSRSESLLRFPVVGTGLFNVLANKRSIQRFNERDAYYSPTSYTERDLDYEWRTAHQPGARFAPAAFVSGALDPHIDLGTVLATLDVPVTLVWGRDTRRTPVSEGERLSDRADVKLIVFEEARLFPHAEHPGPFLDALFEELARVEH